MNEMQDEVVEQSADIVDEAPQTVVEETAEDTHEVSDDTSATSQDQQPNDQEDDTDWDSTVPPIVAPNVNADNGYIDPVAYKEVIKAEIREDIKFQERERRAWSRLEEKYPEVKTDKELRHLILARREFDVTGGGNGSLMGAGKAVMDKFTQARGAGSADAQVSIKTQQNAALSRSTSPRQSSSSDDLRQRVNRGDTTAIDSLLAGWIEDGKI